MDSLDCIDMIEHGVLAFEPWAHLLVSEVVQKNINKVQYVPHLMQNVGRLRWLHGWQSEDVSEYLC